MLMLDTNVVSELRRLDRAAPSVLGWSRSQDPALLCISVITVMELRYGALLLERRDPRQASVYVRWLNEHVLTEFAGRLYPVDSEVALACAALHVPNPRPERDAWIAATALVHGFTLVTRNTRDFEATGVRLFNPWTN